MPRSGFSTLVPTFMAVVWLSGCGASDDDGPIRSETRRELSAWDEVSPLLQFSLDDALPDELYTAELVWNEQTSEMKFSPYAARAQVRWCLAVPDPASGLSLIEEVNVHCDASRVASGSYACQDRLEATLLLRIRSDDGALSEDLPVTFTALSRQNAGYRATNLAFSNFSGTFVISNTGRPGQMLRLGIFGDINPDVASGALLADWVTDAGVESSEIVYTVANWTTPRMRETDATPRCSDF